MRAIKYRDDVGEGWRALGRGCAARVPHLHPLVLARINHPAPLLHSRRSVHEIDVRLFAMAERVATGRRIGPSPVLVTEEILDWSTRAIRAQRSVSNVRNVRFRLDVFAAEG